MELDLTHRTIPDEEKERISMLVAAYLHEKRQTSIRRLLDLNPWLNHYGVKSMPGEKPKPLAIACVENNMPGLLRFVFASDDQLIECCHVAIKNKSIESLSVILSHDGFDISPLAPHLYRIMMSDNENMEITSMLLDAGLKVNKEQIEFIPYGGMAFIIYSHIDQTQEDPDVSLNYKSIGRLIARLIKAGIDINAGDPLKFLVGKNQARTTVNRRNAIVDIMKCMIAAGTDIPEDYLELMRKNNFTDEDIAKVTSVIIDREIKNVKQSAPTDNAKNKLEVAPQQTVSRIAGRPVGRNTAI